MLQNELELGLTRGESEHEASGAPIQLSVENIEKLNADVLMIMADADGRAELEADPRFSELPAVRNDALVWIDTRGPYASIGGGYSGLASMVETTLPQIMPQLEKSGLNTNQ